MDAGHLVPKIPRWILTTRSALAAAALGDKFRDGRVFLLTRLARRDAVPDFPLGKHYGALLLRHLLYLLRGHSFQVVLAQRAALLLFLQVLQRLVLGAGDDLFRCASSPDVAVYFSVCSSSSSASLSASLCLFCSRLWMLGRPMRCVLASRTSPAECPAPADRIASMCCMFAALELSFVAIGAVPDSPRRFIPASSAAPPCGSRKAGSR
eukprot:CAMPEP_0185835998 /NCGR_PEP_ID=MMETSP1353-20130828/8900_1 /TAXON_ID=1077150 /ORGANISM="Erythrolobus australicus, Strain CCMP3124" /LENGTH=208 /DNA_ID=CAMNT_0028534729 /DNA_START=156 /DNA_END=781 /DNA_ORIENTATION=-